MLPAVLVLNPAPTWQRGFLLLTHGVSAASVWSLSWNWLLILGLNVLLAASLFWQWRRPLPVAQLHCLPDGQFALHLQSGEVLEASLVKSSVLTSIVLVLHFRAPEQRYDLVLWPDSADAEVLRQWRVYLRWVWPAKVRPNVHFIKAKQ